MDHAIKDIEKIEFEQPGLLKRVLKTAVINPFANYMPSGMLKALLRHGNSELAAANWKDPGGWRSMVISYEGNPEKFADRLLVNGGTVPMALRNRRRLGAHLLAELIDSSKSNPVHALCLGAGPGRIIIDAMSKAKSDCHATLVDLNSDAFEYGKKIADEANLADKVRFIQADVRDIDSLLEDPPDVVKMIGICEYLTDDQIVEIVTATAKVMPAGAAIVFNSISKAHGTDRFFRRVFGLNMNHRSPAQLQALIGQAGFGDFNATAEPLGVYHVVVGRKTDA